MENILPVKRVGRCHEDALAADNRRRVAKPPHPLAMLQLAKYFPLESPPLLMASQTNIAWGCGVDTGCGACSPPPGHDLPLAKFIPSTDSITLLLRPRYIARGAPTAESDLFARSCGSRVARASAARSQTLPVVAARARHDLWLQPLHHRGGRPATQVGRRGQKPRRRLQICSVATCPRWPARSSALRAALWSTGLAARQPCPTPLTDSWLKPPPRRIAWQ